MVLLVLLLIPLSQAIPLEVTSVDHGSVVIKQLDNPAKFTLQIRNLGETDGFEIYSFVGVTMYPKGNFLLEGGGKTTRVDIEAVPTKDVRNQIDGYYIFEYQLRSEKNGISKETLTIKIVDLKDILSIEASSVKPGERETTVTIRNLENTNLKDLSLNLRSDFFDSNQLVSLEPFEEINVTVPLNMQKMQKAHAGSYPLTSTVSFNGAKIRIPGELRYLEKGALAVDETTKGLIIRSKTYSKTNEGNIPIVAEVTDTKNLVSRLFTTHDPKPLTTTSNGFLISYTWREELAPGEQIVVRSTTNYTVPFILLILIVAIVFAVKFATLRPVMVRKQVSVVKTKNGELALRVRINVKARTHVDNIQIVERIPSIMKVYEKFGIKPDRVDTATRRVIWNLPQLNAGEERVYSYIIYSTIKVVGRIELPATSVLFEKNGRNHESISNVAFLASEMSGS